MLTRLHLRYTRDSLPEDLVFQETQDRANFQARYVLRHPWKGASDACAEAKPYFDTVRQRQERKHRRSPRSPAGTLQSMRTRMALSPQTPQRWWESMWK